jgi:hypothetical protein
MWVYATYEPVAVFGLRPSNTTSSGGKSLICPTPYAVKMAILDRLIREKGPEAGAEQFPQIRDLAIWLRGADTLAITRTFQRVFRPRKTELNEATGRMDVWTSTIAQRELVLMASSLTLALGTDDVAFATQFATLLAAINYFGRRGSFMQLIDVELNEARPTREHGFVDLCQPLTPNDLGFGFLQRMDNMRPDAKWEDVDVVNGRRQSDGGRISYTVVLPYELRRHAFNHTVYALPGVSVR